MGGIVSLPILKIWGTFHQPVLKGNLFMPFPPTREKFHSKHSSPKKALVGYHILSRTGKHRGSLRPLVYSEPASSVTHDMAEAELAAKPCPNQMSPACTI
jgi:hypothetical protein